MSALQAKYPDKPTGNASRPRRHPLRRAAVILAKILAGLLLLCIVAVGGLLYWLRTPAAETLILDETTKALTSLGMTFSAARLSGPLPQRIAIDGLSLADARGPLLRAKRAELRWSITSLYRGTLEVDTLELDDPEIFRLPVLAPDAGEESQPESGGSFGPPVAIRLDNLRLRGGLVHAAVLRPGAAADEPPIEISASGSAALDSSGLSATLRCGVIRRDSGLALDLRLENGPENQLELHVTGEERPGGLLALLLDNPDLPAGRLRLNGAGGLKDWNAELSLLAGVASAGSGLSGANSEPNGVSAGGSGASGAGAGKSAPGGAEAGKPGTADGSGPAGPVDADAGGAATAAFSAAAGQTVSPDVLDVSATLALRCGTGSLLADLAAKPDFTLRLTAGAKPGKNTPPALLPLLDGNAAIDLEISAAGPSYSLKAEAGAAAWSLRLPSAEIRPGEAAGTQTLTAGLQAAVTNPAAFAGGSGKDGTKGFPLDSAAVTAALRGSLGADANALTLDGKLETRGGGHDFTADYAAEAETQGHRASLRRLELRGLGITLEARAEADTGSGALRAEADLLAADNSEWQALVSRLAGFTNAGAQGSPAGTDSRGNAAGAGSQGNAAEAGAQGNAAGTNAPLGGELRLNASLNLPGKTAGSGGTTADSDGNAFSASGGQPVAGEGKTPSAGSGGNASAGGSDGRTLAGKGGSAAFGGTPAATLADGAGLPGNPGGLLRLTGSDMRWPTAQLTGMLGPSLSLSARLSPGADGKTWLLALEDTRAGIFSASGTAAFTPPTPAGGPATGKATAPGGSPAADGDPATGNVPADGNSPPAAPFPGRLEAELQARVSDLAPLGPGLGGALTATVKASGPLNALDVSLNADSPALTAPNGVFRGLSLDLAAHCAMTPAKPDNPNEPDGAGRANKAAGPAVAIAGNGKTANGNAPAAGNGGVPATVSGKAGNSAASGNGKAVRVSAGDGSVASGAQPANGTASGNGAPSGSAPGSGNAPASATSAASGNVAVSAADADKADPPVGNDIALSGSVSLKAADSPGGPLSLSGRWQAGLPANGRTVSAGLSDFLAQGAGVKLSASLSGLVRNAQVPASADTSGNAAGNGGSGRAGAGQIPLVSLKGELNADVHDWGRIAALSGAPLSGGPASLRLRLDNAGGGQSAALDLTLQSLVMKGAAGGQPSLALEGVSASLNVPRIVLDGSSPLASLAPDFRLRLGPGLAGPLRWSSGNASVKGQAGAGEFSLAMHPAAAPAARSGKKGGSAAAAAELLALRGRYDLNRQEATVSALSMSIPPLAGGASQTSDRANGGFRLQRPFSLKFADGLQLAGLDMAFQPGGRLTADASLAPGSMRLKAALQALPFGFFALFTDAPLPGGELGLTADITASAQGARGNVTVKSRVKPAGSQTGLVKAKADGSGAAPPAEALDLNLTAALAANAVSGSGVFGRASAPDGSKEGKLAFRIPLRPSPDGTPAPDSRAPMTASLRWNGSVAPLWQAVPVPDRYLSGQLLLDAAVSGSMEAPRPALTAYLGQGRYEDIAAGVLLTDIRLQAKLTPEGNLNALLAAGDGRKGTLALEAALRGLLGKAAPHLAVRGQMNDLNPLHRDDLSIALSGIFGVNGPADAPAVTADIRVDQGELTVSSSLGGSVATLDVVSADDVRSGPQDAAGTGEAGGKAVAGPKAPTAAGTDKAAGTGKAGAVQTAGSAKGAADGKTVAAGKASSDRGSGKSDDRRGGKPGGKTAASGHNATPAAPAVAGPSLDVRVAIPRQFFIRGMGLDSEWEGDLRISGAAADPSLTGALRPVRGHLDILSKTFEFTGGDISFTGGMRVNPLINLELTYVGPSVTAIIRAAGSAKKPKLALESRPPLPRDEILAQVLFGKRTSDLSRFEAIQLANSLRELTNAGGSSLDVLTGMRKTVGLDVLRVGSQKEAGQRTTSGQSGENELTGGQQNDGGQGEGVPSLEAGKYINDSIYIGVEQGATPDSTAVRVEVELFPSVNLQGQSSATATEVGVGWKKDY